MCEIYFIASESEDCFCWALRPRRSPGNITLLPCLMSPADRDLIVWLSSLLPSPVTRQNISFRQYLGGGGCGWVCGCQVNNWICRRVKKRERCSNPSAANQIARMQISTNHTPVKSSTLLSEACRSLRNKQIYPWERERGYTVFCYYPGRILIMSWTVLFWS